MKFVLTDQGLAFMKIDLRNFAKYFYKNVTVNDVLKEAVMNSIQANATSININLEYDYKDNLFGDSSDLGPLKEIVITDNGKGFTPENIKAFFEVATAHKANIGGKGIGRISFLKIANKIEVESVSFDGSLVRFDFSYDSTEDDVDSQPSQEESTYTKFILSELDLKHPRTEVASCVNFLREKFNLMMFLREQEIEKTLEINVLVNDQLYEVIKSSDTQYIENKTHMSGPCEFDIYVFNNPEKRGISISYYANNLQVSSRIVSKGFKSQYIFAITSPYFDENVNPERTKFDFGEQAQKDLLLETPAKGFEGELEQICLEMLQALEPNIKEENQLKINEMKKRYGYINFEEIDPNTLFFDEKEFLERYRKKVNADEDRLAAIIDSPNVSLEMLVNRVSEQNKHELAKYIFHRDIVAKKGLDLSGSKENEEVLHNLFFPQNTTTNSNSCNLGELYTNGVWLLDDKFMSYVYAASDVAMSRIYKEVGDGGSCDASRSRPDLFILYNTPEESDAFKDVVLIEFKKGDINYKDKTTAIDQVDEYKVALMKIVKNIKNFYCYIICDFDADDKNLERVMKNRAFTKVFSNAGCIYYGYLPGSKTHVTFASSKSIFTDAVARNKTFLEILKRT